MKPYLEIASFLLSKISCSAKENSNEPLSLPHLKWMLLEIIHSEMSTTKSSRWLGYIYAALEGFKVIETLEKEQILERFSGLENSGHQACNIVCEGYLNSDMLEINNRFEGTGSQCKPFVKTILESIIETKLSDQESNFLLGYAQGIMVKNGLISVNEERNRTRDIFNGS